MGKTESKTNSTYSDFTKYVKLVDPSNINNEYLLILKSKTNNHSYLIHNSFSNKLRDNKPILSLSLHICSQIINKYLNNISNLNLISSTLTPNYSFNTNDDNSLQFQIEIIRFISNIILWFDSKIKSIIASIGKSSIFRRNKPLLNTIEGNLNLRDYEEILNIPCLSNLSRKSSKGNDLSKIEKCKTSSKINAWKNGATTASDHLTERQSNLNNQSKPRSRTQTPEIKEKSKEKSNKDQLKGFLVKKNSQNVKKSEINIKCDLKKENNKVLFKEPHNKLKNNLNKIIVTKEKIEHTNKPSINYPYNTNIPEKKIKSQILNTITNEKPHAKETKNIKNININIKLNIINKQGSMTPRTNSNSLIKSNSIKKIVSHRRFEVLNKSPKNVENVVKENAKENFSPKKKHSPSHDRITLKSDSEKSRDTLSSKKRNTPHFHLHKQTNSFCDGDFILNDRFSFKPIFNQFGENESRNQNRSFIQYIEPKIKHI